MDIGNPLIYTCPSCGKKMAMTTWTSYTVSSSKCYSDGDIKQSGICCPNFTPDLAKCPHCKKLFFRHEDTNAEYVNFYTNKVKKDIEDPTRDDLIKAVENKLFKKWQEEMALREMLWHDLNGNVRYECDQLSGDKPATGTKGKVSGIFKIWQDNCAALLRLAEKNFKEMQLEKNRKEYSSSDRDNCILMMAELNRNLGNFDKSMETINKLNGKWGWLKKQFAWECNAKNIFIFQLIPKDLMNLEKAKEQYGSDYYERGQLFLPSYYGRRNIKKAIADFIKAEKLGMRGITFYYERGCLYLEELNDPDSAISDFTKALKQKDRDEWSQRFISDIHNQRSNAYVKKGNLKKALAEIQKALDEDSDNDILYTSRSAIYKAMGNADAAKEDELKAQMLQKEDQEYRKKQQEEWKAQMKKPAKKGVAVKKLKPKKKGITNIEEL